MTQSGEELVHAQMNRLRGHLCGAIEAAGLPERQERGIIATLKTLSYESEKIFVQTLRD